MTDAVAPTSVVFVCWGNICRSPMAERVARRQAADAGLDGVTFTSAGVSAEESGNPIDSRARAVLTRHGYEASGHHAHQITASEIAEADLVIGLEPLHLDRMRSLAPGANNLALLTDFDPDAPPGSGVVRIGQYGRAHPTCTIRATSVGKASSRDQRVPPRRNSTVAASHRTMP